MEALRAHYDSPDQVKAWIDVSRAGLEKLFCKNEHMLSFESYSTQMKLHNVLEKCYQPEYKTNNIDAFLKGICNENVKVVNTVSITCTHADLNAF